MAQHAGRPCTLTPADAGGAGVGQTYYTTDGTDPTDGVGHRHHDRRSTTDGVYTIKYFSVDAVGNAEPVKTAGTQIRIDTAAPVTDRQHGDRSSTGPTRTSPSR